MSTQQQDDRPEDPGVLTLAGWLSQAFDLPLKEAAKRILNLLRRTVPSALAIRRHMRVARKSGKTPKFLCMPSKLGDVIAAEPVLEMIKTENDLVAWICQDRYADVLAHHPQVDRVICVSSYTETILLKYFAPKASWYNLITDGTLCNSFGFEVKNPGPLGINCTNYYRNGALADVYALIGTGGLAQRRPAVYIDRGFDADAYLQTLFPPGRRPLITVHFASDEFVRSWDEHAAVTFARTLVAELDCDILECGLKPYTQPSEHVRHLGAALPLSSQAAILARSDVFVAVDSGFSHMANGLHVPTVYLLGRYRNFPGYTPWKTDGADVILRSEQQVFRISAQDVCDAVKQILRTTTPKREFEPNV